MILRILAITGLLLGFVYGAAAQDSISDAQYLREWKAENTARYAKAKKKGKLLVIAGGATMATGFAFASGGIYLMNHSDDFLSTHGSVELPAKKAGGLFMALFGGLNIVGSLGFFIPGGKYLRYAKELKIKAQKRGVDLTYEPFLLPTTNSYGVSLKATF